MRESRFSLAVSAEEYLEYYRGIVQQVVVRAHNGQKIQFPAKELRPFVTQNGIHGNFRILYSDDNKFVRIERI